MDNPPVYKPLSKRREVNAMWRHYAQQRKDLRAPLSEAEIEELKIRANGVGIHSPNAELRRKLAEELFLERAKTGKYQGKPTGLSPRFLRRRYKNILEEYIPMISEENGTWKVDGGARGPKRNYPPLDPKHMAGFTSSDGTKVQEVNTKGQFIKITE
jgi:hypothetical protein